MSDHYATLPVEGRWVPYLRTRLPYSFKRIQEIKASRRYQLDEPFLTEDTPFSAVYHNYWKRGNIFYLMGKIGDCHELSNAGEQIHVHIENPLWSQVYGPMLPQLLPFSQDIWNTLQVAKMWKQVQGYTLERERVAMSNVLLAVELCLKAVMVHARKYEDNVFTFDITHDISQLFDHLPRPLQDEIVEESAKFAVEYYTYCRDIRENVLNMHGGYRNSMNIMRDPELWEAARQRWVQLLEQTDGSPYTVFANNSEAAVDPSLADSWFTESLAQLKSIEGMDRGTYFRYAPFHSTDELPPDILSHVLLLGRFLYEYLFPVALSSEPYLIDS